MRRFCASAPPARSCARRSTACRLPGRRNRRRCCGGCSGALFRITAPFWCDYGYNIEIGENFYANHNCVILDCARVTFGRNVLVGPDCGFYAAAHPIDPARRAAGLEYALPIAVGDDVWFGGGVRVMPGVTIGSGSLRATRAGSCAPLRPQTQRGAIRPHDRCHRRERGGDFSSLPLGRVARRRLRALPYPLKTAKNKKYRRIRTKFVAVALPLCYIYNVFLSGRRAPGGTPAPMLRKHLRERAGWRFVKRAQEGFALLTAALTACALPPLPALAEAPWRRWKGLRSGRTGSAARQTTGRRAPAAAGDQPRRRNRRQEGARLHDLWPRSENGNRPGGRHARHERERTPGFRIGTMFLAPPGPGFPGFPAGVPQQQRKITAPPRGCLKGAGHRLWPARPRFTSCVTSRRACFCCCGYRHPPAVGIAVARPPQ